MAIISCKGTSAGRAVSTPSAEMGYMIEHSHRRTLFVDNGQTLRHLLSAFAAGLIGNLNYIFALFASPIEASEFLAELSVV